MRVDKAYVHKRVLQLYWEMFPDEVRYKRALIVNTSAKTKYPVSSGLMQRVEKERTNFKADSLVNIAGFFNVGIETIINDDWEKKSSNRKEVREESHSYQPIAPTLHSDTLSKLSELDSATLESIEKLIHCYMWQDQKHKDFTLLIAESYLPKQKFDKYKQKMDELFRNKDNNNASPDTGTEPKE